MQDFETQAMENGEDRFVVEELDGYRMIRVRFPQAIRVNNLPSALSHYFSLWEEEVPTVVFVDATRLTTITPELREVLRVVPTRLSIQPNFLGSVWYVGENDALKQELQNVLSEAGRDPMIVCKSEARAYAILRSYLPPKGS